MRVKVYASAVFWGKATSLTAEVHVDAGIAYPLAGIPDIALSKVAMERLDLPARAYDNTPKVLRSIADPENPDNIKAAQISEAIPYRSLNREGWLG